jgi:hypothetical protein
MSVDEPSRHPKSAARYEREPCRAAINAGVKGYSLCSSNGGRVMKTIVTAIASIVVLAPSTVLAQGVSAPPTRVCQIGGYGCPIHPDMQATWPARCPLCQTVLSTLPSSDAARAEVIPVAARGGSAGSAPSGGGGRGSAPGRGGMGTNPGMGMRPGMQPGMGVRPGMGMYPGMRPGMGMNPGMYPGMGMRPGMQTGMGMHPGMGMPSYQGGQSRGGYANQYPTMGRGSGRGDRDHGGSGNYGNYGNYGGYGGTSYIVIPYFFPYGGYGYMDPYSGYSMPYGGYGGYPYPYYNYGFSPFFPYFTPFSSFSYAPNQ